MSSLPWWKFNNAAWRNDPCLRLCSLEARGLWIEMLALMQQSSRPGFLLAPSGHPLTAGQLALLIGRPPEEVSRGLQELNTNGVYSCTSDGIIYCRRIVREKRKSDLCSKAGKSGGGNPTFKGQAKGDLSGQDKGGPKGAAKGEAKGKEYRVESSDKEIGDTPLPPSGGKPAGAGGGGADAVAIPARINTEKFRANWERWRRFLGDRRKPLTRDQASMQLALLEEQGEEDAVRMIQQSLLHGWTALYPIEEARRAETPAQVQDTQPKAADDEPSDQELEARQRTYLAGIGYSGQALEEAMKEFREALAGAVMT